MAVYWYGADKNIYYKGDNGVVKNIGQPSKGEQSLYEKGVDTNSGSYVADYIADPNRPAAPGNPNNTTAAPKVDKSNDIALNRAGLGAVDSQTAAGMSSIDAALGKLTGQYDTEATTNEGSYTSNSNQNQTNLQKNKQTALVNAAQGRQGLMGTLSSLGALNGSGIDLANRAVTKGANDDLSGAADNYSTNQSGLDTAIGTFRQEDKMRRENAATAAENAKTNVRGDAAKSRMSFLSNLSNDYAAMGDSGNAKTYSDQAAALYPEIAKSSVPNSNISYSGAAFTPGTLADYMAGANSTVVSATPAQPGQSIPGLVASPTKKKQLQPA
jgi:hypothetical protein